jgi:hypothetical protein
MVGGGGGGEAKVAPPLPCSHCTLLPPALIEAHRMTDDPTEDWAVREHRHSHQVRQINSRCRRGSRRDANRNLGLAPPRPSLAHLAPFHQTIHTSSTTTSPETTSYSYPA